ncbi:hypothetical protein ACE38W_10080 [Chitinophaga sp. Hz27]|uniref:hypothetical protein n=1 Tax=Chitinophaga sp. Hz27 TaxID=3347169 RepID=UPI0035DC6D04
MKIDLYKFRGVVKSIVGSVFYLVGFFIFLFMATGCKDPSFDANALGQKYCNCMEKHHAEEDFYNARVICDSKFILENKYFRAYYIESFYGNGYMGTLDKKFRDSVNDFNYSLYMYLNDHCPYMLKGDSIRKEYLHRMDKAIE